LAPQGFFYGHNRTREQAAKQMAFLNRLWPQRRYAAPESVDVYAIPNRPEAYKVVRLRIRDDQSSRTGTFDREGSSYLHFRVRSRGSSNRRSERKTPSGDHHIAPWKILVVVPDDDAPLFASATAVPLRQMLEMPY
jgi:hypothetical protein